MINFLRSKWPTRVPSQFSVSLQTVFTVITVTTTVIFTASVCEVQIITCVTVSQFISVSRSRQDTISSFLFFEIRFDKFSFDNINLVFFDHIFLLSLNINILYS